MVSVEEKKARVRIAIGIYRLLELLSLVGYGRAEFFSPRGLLRTTAVGVMSSLHFFCGTFGDSGPPEEDKR